MLSASVPALAIAALFSSLLWLVTARARPHLAKRERVIMQWSLTGQPTSWASPRLALSLTPAVGTATLFLIVGLASSATPQEDRGAGLALFALVGLVLVAIHAAHMWFAIRSPHR